MRTTSLLKVGPPITSGGGGGCSTARCRAAMNAKTKADARMMRRIPAGATSYARNHSRLVFVRSDDSAVVRDLPIDDRQYALGIGKSIDGNAEDVLRQHRDVREFAGGDRSFFVFRKFREGAAARVGVDRFLARDRLGRVAGHRGDELEIQPGIHRTIGT